jgi:hypothetical protein
MTAGPDHTFRDVVREAIGRREDAESNSPTFRNSCLSTPFAQTTAGSPEISNCNSKYSQI